MAPKFVLLWEDGGSGSTGIRVVRGSNQKLAP